MDYTINGRVITGTLVALVLLCGAASLGWLSPATLPHQMACTLEAKICPDGSSVGRTGPRCEFAECPSGGSLDLLDTFSDSQTGMSFEYPRELAMEYIHPQVWPPKLEIRKEPFVCIETPADVGVAGATEKRTVNGHTYCVNVTGEGAAGTMYAAYEYAFPYQNKSAKLSFTLRSVQCLNYDEPKQTQCQNERSAFDVDLLADQIIQTVRSGQ